MSARPDPPWQSTVSVVTVSPGRTLGNVRVWTPAPAKPSRVAAAWVEATVTPHSGASTTEATPTTTVSVPEGNGSGRDKVMVPVTPAAMRTPASAPRRGRAPAPSVSSARTEAPRAVV